MLEQIVLCVVCVAVFDGLGLSTKFAWVGRRVGFAMRLPQTMRVKLTSPFEVGVRTPVTANHLGGCRRCARILRLIAMKPSLANKLAKK